MVERRKHRRTLTFKTGKITRGNEMPALDCAILDISACGSCLLVPEGAEVPPTFILTLDRTGATYTCNVRFLVSKVV